MRSAWRSAVELLPEGLRRAAEALPEELRDAAEELRLRRGQAPTALCLGRERPLRGAPLTGPELREVLDRAARGSYHAVLDQLRRGFLSAPFGVRLGVCGPDGDPEAVNALCLRIPRQVPEAGREVMGTLGEGSVLILSPPGGGKTTFLRELVRRSSEAGRRVGLADERGEVAAVFQGEPQFELGPCTDVLSLLPKAEAATRLLRAMNEEIVALDEISDPADLAAVERLSGSGVRVFATVHAASVEALRTMPRFAPILRERVFQTAVVISPGPPRRYRAEAL